MIRITTIVFAGLALAITLSVAPAKAQNARSFVSGHGIDTAACTLAAPCRTLAHALTQTNAGGEIDVLDPAGYGSLTIDRAISIVNDGVGTAGVIVPSGGIGITISAGTSDAVSLRGLSIEGSGVGSTGIRFATGQSLTVENCVIRHVTASGIDLLANVTSSLSLSVSNSLISDNGLDGIAIRPSGAGAVTVVLNRVQLNNNARNGITTGGGAGSGSIQASVYDSAASGNAGVGFDVSGAAPATLMLFHSIAANNSTGLQAESSSATLRLINSMVTGNANGWTVSNSGSVLSYGNNSIDGNDSNEAAPPTTALK